MLPTREAWLYSHLSTHISTKSTYRWCIFTTGGFVLHSGCPPLLPWRVFGCTRTCQPHIFIKVDLALQAFIHHIFPLMEAWFSKQLSITSCFVEGFVPESHVHHRCGWESFILHSCGVFLHFTLMNMKFWNWMLLYIMHSKLLFLFCLHQFERDYNFFSKWKQTITRD